MKMQNTYQLNSAIDVNFEKLAGTQYSLYCSGFLSTIVSTILFLHSEDAVHFPTTLNQALGSIHSCHCQFLCVCVLLLHVNLHAEIHIINIKTL